MRRLLAAGVAVAASSALLAGCGGGGSGSSAENAAPSATGPASVAAPVAVSAVGVGGTVTAGPTTPKAVAAALKGSGVVVVAFVQRGVADDDAVAAAVAGARRDPASSHGVAFFEYDVAKDKFGDLADRLGVEGTPSVAVIGRDRTLVNLWTGLIDADILRQSIADAQDTVAAHPGAKAVSGAPRPRAAITTGPTGDAGGIALAKKVNAAYVTVPGVKVTGPQATRDFGTGKADVDVALKDGIATAEGGIVQFKGFSVELREVSKDIFFRSGDGCWSGVRGGADPHTIGQPAIELFGRFGAPKTAGGTIKLPVTQVFTEKTNRIVYTIDAATSRVLTVSDSDGTVLKWTTLESAPSIAAPTDMCSNPKDAFKGLPKSLGGTS